MERDKDDEITHGSRNMWRDMVVAAAAVVQGPGEGAHKTEDDEGKFTQQGRVLCNIDSVS